MNALKKRGVAIVITAVVIVAAVFGGSHRSLAACRSKADALYETGTGADGSIAQDRLTQMDICANTASLAEQYGSGEAAARLRQAVQRARETNGREGYDEARALADELLGALGAMSSLTQQDAGYVRTFLSQLDSYDAVIARNGYNAAARAFNEEVLGRFPANVLGPLTGVRPLEVFE